MSSLNYSNLNDFQKQELLNDLYLTKKLSFQDIAEKHNTYANKLRRDAKKFNIKIRDKSQAQKNALNTGKHKHPTKGQERPENVKEKIGKGVMDAWDQLSEKELKARQEKSRANWEIMDSDTKTQILKLANEAARLSSKTGSKLEKFFLEGLLRNGYKIDFHKEQILSNTKLQIDLFLPTINLAIEVDGPSHFSPIWGDQALERNKKYDEKKNGLLSGKGTSLIRVKQTKDFSVTRANIMLQKILDIISNKEFKNNALIEIEDN
jgi:very-short-patch-repair endonuclease